MSTGQRIASRAADSSPVARSGSPPMSSQVLPQDGRSTRSYEISIVAHACVMPMVSFFFQRLTKTKTFTTFIRIQSQLKMILSTSLFACWFQPAQSSQPTVFFSHNKPALASPNQPRNQPANMPHILKKVRTLWSKLVILD